MADRHPQGSSGQGAGRSHQPSRIAFWKIVGFGIVIALVLAAAIVLLRIFLKAEIRTNPKEGIGIPVAEARAPMPEPRLETSPADDLEAMRREEDRQLETYGWVDRDRRIFRIPIQAAMEKLVRRGLPVRAPTRPAE
jgi:hypothetical protein